MQEEAIGAKRTVKLGNLVLQRESKSWQQLVMEEASRYYNNDITLAIILMNTTEGVTKGDIEVHYNWKQMLGLEEQTPFPIDPNANLEKFKKHGN